MILRQAATWNPLLQCCNAWTRTNISSSNKIQRNYKGLKIAVCMHSWGKLWTAAKLLQSCLTLCDPIDGSPPGFPIPGILQARTLEWVAISFSNAWKLKSESEVAQSCPTLSDPMDCSLLGSSVHGIFQARVLEWGAIAFSKIMDKIQKTKKKKISCHFWRTGSKSRVLHMPPAYTTTKAVSKSAKPPLLPNPWTHHYPHPT